jgi:DNA end-binding protein Ku
MAHTLVESMSADFVPDEYTDNYRQALQEVVDAKVAGRKVVTPWKEERVLPDGMDLMTALEMSVAQQREKQQKPPRGVKP